MEFIKGKEKKRTKVAKVGGLNICFWRPPCRESLYRNLHVAVFKLEDEQYN